MALLDGEVNQLRWLMGYPMLTTGAEPYVGIAAAFDRVIQPYIRTGAATTSSTSVTAASTPTPTTLTLADGSSFNTGDRIVVDVDSRQEVAVAQLVSGNSLTLILSLAHSGTYPVTVEGSGEAAIRWVLRRARDIRQKQETVGLSTAGIKKADEVEFFPGGMGGVGATYAAQEAQLCALADEATLITGLQNMRSRKHRAGSSMSCY